MPGKIPSTSFVSNDERTGVHAKASVEASTELGGASELDDLHAASAHAATIAKRNLIGQEERPMWPKARQLDDAQVRVRGSSRARNSRQ